MKQIVYISGSRSDYSLIKRTLAGLDIITELTVVATCMHLSNQFGNTYREIESDGFKVKKVDMLLDNDSLGSMVKSLGIGLYGITHILEDISPDLVFIEGDRGEALAGAIAAAHLNIPIIHHGGGDISGSIDNKIRSAISVLADFHLTGNQRSYQRLLCAGIPAGRITLVGEPGIDDILSGDYTQIEQVNKKYGIPSGKPMILLIQHPDTRENQNIDTDVRTILEVIAELEIPTVAIYSNSDAGGRVINSVLDEKSIELPFLKVFSHVERRDFLGLMNRCSVMLGNSSAGIVELPSFKKPFVCVGSRQKDRLQTENTINVECEKSEIIDALHHAMQDEAFVEKLSHVKNPYGDGHASEKIVNRIMEILEKENGSYNREDRMGQCTTTISRSK
jgi:GDP/UDP-N,N'-diacetylbacillosamine 2-epimerase (hydrolysing)